MAIADYEATLVLFKNSNSDYRPAEFGEDYCMIPFERDAGFVSAKYMEGVETGAILSRYHTVDNIFAHPSRVRANYYDIYIPTDEIEKKVSDHNPVYGDFILE